MNADVYFIPPDPEEYNQLRVKAGLSPKDIAASATALQNSIFTVTIREKTALIGMGRIIGDRGCFFQVVDIAVSPDYQGQGIGKLIMKEITNYLDMHAPKHAYVSLIADIPADHLYKKFGFEYTYPNSVGMYKKY